MNELRSVAIFCASSLGSDACFQEDAFSLGRFLAGQNIDIVYGGAKVGLMGALANGALSVNGRVIGIIPDFLKDKEVAHDSLTELIVVKSMHERKMIMFEKSNGAIVLPGGFGTLDEMFELLTWGQLGLHKKPVGILNVKGYYDLLITFIENMVSQNLLRKSNQDMLLVSNDISELIEKMKNYEAPDKAKWISKDQV